MILKMVYLIWTCLVTVIFVVLDFTFDLTAVSVCKKHMRIQ